MFRFFGLNRQVCISKVNHFSYICSLTEKVMATHSSTLAWKIPWLEEPGRQRSKGSHRVRHNWSSFAAVQLFETTQTAACQVPLSTGCPWQEYWSELPFPSLGDLPDLGIEPIDPHLLHCRHILLPLSHLQRYPCFILWNLWICCLSWQKGLCRYD